MSRSERRLGIVIIALFVAALAALLVKGGDGDGQIAGSPTPTPPAQTPVESPTPTLDATTTPQPTPSVAPTDVFPTAPEGNGGSTEVPQPGEDDLPNTGVRGIAAGWAVVAAAALLAVRARKPDIGRRLR